MTISEIKQTAKARLTGTYIKCASSSLLYFIVVLVLSFIQQYCYSTINNSFVLTLLQTIFTIISLILSYGIISNIINLSDVKTNAITDFLNQALKNTFKYIKVLSRVIVRMAIPIILSILALYYLFGNSIAKAKEISFLCFSPDQLIISLILFIAMVLVFIYTALNYVLIPYIYYNSKDLSSKDIVNKSKEIMKGKKIKYILLILSFLNWILVAALIIYILTMFIHPKYLTPLVILFYSMLKPYITICNLEFYENSKE